MPFLTRDVAIFLGLVVFLLVGITATATNSLRLPGQSAAVAGFAPAENNEETVYTAVLPEETAADTRAEKVRTLSNKVGDFLAEVGETVLPEPEPELEETETPPEEEVESGTVLTCAEYVRSNPAWSSQGLKFEVVEGALLVYRDREVLAEPAGEGASTTLSLVPTIEREVVLQLPHRLFATGASACLSTDIVGIALDGSLIRNSDYTAYRVFGSETQIGYALDGYAIYGTATFATDTCGGSDVGGEYGYYLSPEREGVIGCFNATPVSL
jgi:hypothetical protein